MFLGSGFLNFINQQQLVTFGLANVSKRFLFQNFKNFLIIEKQNKVIWWGSVATMPNGALSENSICRDLDPSLPNYLGRTKS